MNYLFVSEISDMYVCA